MIPNKYLRVDKIKYTTSFKIDRRAMKEIFLSSIDVKNDFEVVKNDIDSEIYAVIGEIVEYSASQIGYGVKLKDIGVDSLKLIMLIVSLEEKYEIEFHDQLLSRNMFYYCGELYDYVKALIEQKEK